MTHKEFTSKIWAIVDEYPDDWRPGQKVFNACAELFGSVAREVQFIDGVDCFYNNQRIDDFINAVWERVKDDDN